MSIQQHSVWGITGHRRLLQPEDLFQRLLKEGEKMLASGEVYGLTPLAEGADRIWAKVLVELGIPYSVPLPLAQQDYERDFPESLKEFRFLLEKAQSVFTLPRCPWLSESDIQPNASGRSFQYLSAGVYIINQSDVLISAWDGKPARGIGGTAQITQIFQDFTVLKDIMDEEKYLYFQSLGKRNSAKSRKLISMDVV